MENIMSRIYNFSAGPATLPEEVLVEAQSQLVDFQGAGMSLMEMSHRGKPYMAVQEEAEANLRKLMNISDDYAVLFLQGGASGQFAMVPMNLRGEGESADFTHSGSWAGKAIKEAKVTGNVNIVADVSKESPARMPATDELNWSDGAAYAHITSNETIGGTQWKEFPKTSAPLVADMSSDILSRPLDVDQFGIIYAGAQKNIGPSGVTLVIMRKDLADKASDSVPLIYRYKTHIENGSMYNTPPCFAIYMIMLVTRWLEKNGGIAAMQAINETKAAKLYEAIDGTGFYNGTADVGSRSLMNGTFRLGSEDLEAQFIKEAGAQGLSGLKGHRSVGGVRASIYNAFPAEGVDALIAFMKDFEAKNG